MILSKQLLKHYLAEDLKRFKGKKPSLKDWILNNESWYIYHYLRHLRFVEYYKNTGFYTLSFIWHYILYKRLGFKLHFTIYPNTVGPGFHIYHVGDFVHIGPNVKMGANCTVLPGVVFGNKYEEADSNKITIGDNCYFGLGVKVFGTVTIGDNVIVGANAVVTKSIPANAVAGGIPAKIIRIR